MSYPQDLVIFRWTEIMLVLRVQRTLTSDAVPSVYLHGNHYQQHKQQRSFMLILAAKKCTMSRGSFS